MSAVECGRTIVIGAGPAGLTAAYTLQKAGAETLVLEADPKYVGGISRTVDYRGFRFDIGGHRFFSKSVAVNALWRELMPEGLLVRPRSSRIFYRGRFFAYPLRPVEALLKLGLLESARCVLSYLKAKIRPVAAPRNFRDWVSNQFGRRLFEIFFETYTEKVWGMACAEISADWAAQRIKGLTLGTAVKDALRSHARILGPRMCSTRDEVETSLITSFLYPRLGPGMMWEACAAKVQALGGDVRLGRRVVSCCFDEQSKEWEVRHQGDDGVVTTERSRHVISTAPLTELVAWLGADLPDDVKEAAAGLRYRDFLTVMLILPERHRFDDNWIYVHDPKVRVGRIQNFKSWSPEMVPDPSLCCYGLEYFCFEGDGLWSMSDEELLALAAKELEQVGLGAPDDVLDGCVVRQPKAYPVYDDDYALRVERVRQALVAYPTLQTVGRNGMHRYNNQDHAMMTAVIAAKNILAGERRYDPWQVNNSAEYHERGAHGDSEENSAAGVSTRLVPHRV